MEEFVKLSALSLHCSKNICKVKSLIKKSMKRYVMFLQKTRSKKYDFLQKNFLGQVFSLTRD